MRFRPIRRRFARRRLAAALAVLCCGFSLAAGAEPQTPAAKAEPPCAMTPFGTAEVAQIVDGRTLLLADGREVRLAGIELPPAGDPASPSAGAVLAALTGKNPIVLRALKPLTDRHGRLVADPAVSQDGAAVSLARDLVARGLALVSARAATVACAAELMAAERAARAGRLGLWADPRYLLVQADHPAVVLAQRGRSVMVEGVVASVRDSGGTIYVNFGRRWSEDFTVTILKRNERRFTAAGLEPKTLQGRRVLVRGVIEQRGGPWIEATVPGQIEIVTSD